MEKKGKRKVKIKSIMFLFVIIIFTCCCIFIFTKKDSILIEKKEKGYLASSTYTIDLYEYLNNFLPMETTNIPIDSIVREFIGNGCFNR